MEFNIRIGRLQCYHLYLVIYWYFVLLRCISVEEAFKKVSKGCRPDPSRNTRISHYWHFKLSFRQVILDLALWRCNWIILNIAVLLLHARKQFAQDTGFELLFVI